MITRIFRTLHGALMSRRLLAAVPQVSASEVIVSCPYCEWSLQAPSLLAMEFVSIHCRNKHKEMT